MAHLLPTAVEPPARPALTTQRSAGPLSLRLLSGALFAEWAAGTVVAGLAASLAAARIPVGQPFGTGPVAPAAVAAIAALALVPLLAALATWRQAGAGALGRAGRVAVAGAVFGNLGIGLAGVYGLRDMDAVALAAPAVVVGFGSAYAGALALRARAAEPAPSAEALRDPLEGSGPSGAALLTGILVVAIYAAAGAISWLQYRTYAPEVDPPSELTVCSGHMNAACAATAAGRSDLRVAWLAEGGLVRPLYTLLEPRFVQQDFETVGRVDGSLYTAREELPPAGAKAGTVPVGDAAGQVSIAPVQGDEWSVNIDWAKAGTNYRLTTYPPGSTERADAIAQAAKLAAAVAYATPPPGTPPPVEP